MNTQVSRSPFPFKVTSDEQRASWAPMPAPEPWTAELGLLVLGSLERDGAPATLSVIATALDIWADRMASVGSAIQVQHLGREFKAEAKRLEALARMAR